MERAMLSKYFKVFLLNQLFHVTTTASPSHPHHLNPEHLPAESEGISSAKENPGKMVLLFLATLFLRSPACVKGDYPRGSLVSTDAGAYKKNAIAFLVGRTSVRVSKVYSSWLSSEAKQTHCKTTESRIIHRAPHPEPIE